MTPPRIRRVAVLALLLPAVALLAAPSHAAAAIPLRPGLGHRVDGGDFVGFYRDAAGTRMYCIDPQAAAPTSVTLTATARVRGLSRTVTRQLAYALTQWGGAQTSDAAAIESQVLNTLAGNMADVRRRARALPHRFGPSVAEHVRLARQLAGPYSVRVSLRPLTPGQSALGAVEVRSAAGYRVPGVSLDLRRSSAVAAPTQVRTGADGVARFAYRVTDVGEVRILAIATNLASDKVRSTRPPAGVQRMLSTATSGRAGGAATFRRQLGGLSHSYACTSTCDGRPAAALWVCAPASSLTSRIEYHVGTAVLSWTFRPARNRTCHTTRVQLRDGERVSADWRYRTGRAWSVAVPVAGTFTVDCPPVPAVNVSMTYTCQAATVRIVLSGDDSTAPAVPLVNPSRHTMVLVIGGDEPRRIYAPYGHSAVFTATRSCAEPTTLTAQAGVQRSNGEWNYGHLVSVSTPGQG